MNTTGIAKGLVAAAASFGAFCTSVRAADPYIESDGTDGTGIVTDYCLKPTSRVEVDFQLTTAEQTKDARLFGADYNHVVLGLSGSFYVGGAEGTLWVIHLGNGEKYDNVWPKDGNGDYLALDADRHTVVIDYPTAPHLFITGSVTNEIPNEDFTPQSFVNESTRPIALFARQNSAGALEKQIKAKIFGVKIYEKADGRYALVRNYVPCKKDGMPGFKDVVSGGFFCNPAVETHMSAGGDFLVEESPYVATPTGNNTDAAQHMYIDTGYYATANTRLELDYALTEARPAGATWYVFSGESQFGSFIQDAGAGFVVKTSQWKTGVAPSVANIVGVKRTAILDVPGKWCGLVTGTCTNDYKSITTNDVFANTSTIKLASYAGANNYFASAKIYGCRIYEAGTLVRDFRPYVIGPARDGSVVVGLKDELTGAFITYPGATASKRLSCGGTEPIVAPPYVQTLRSSSQYIKTGYQVKVNTKVDLDYAPAEARVTGDTWYLFWNKNVGVFSAYVNNNGFGFINDSSNWKGGVGTSCNPDSIAVRRIVTLDNSASQASVTTDFGASATQAMPGPGSYDFNRLELQLGANLPAANFASMRIFGLKIWEKDAGEYVLKHDFAPAVVDGIAGLMDSISGTFKTCEASAASPLTYGGAFTPDVGPIAAATLGVGESTTFVASAPGATSYRWTRNGQAIAGGENGTLTVHWRKGGGTDEYCAVARYAIDDAICESAPSASVSVENVKSGLSLIIR